MAVTPKIVVVTGASAGVGRAIARRFGRERWRVALVARSADRLEAAAAEIQDAGGEALVLPADTSDSQAVFAARDVVLAQWGQIDVWVNAAMATVVAPIRDITPEEFRRVTEVTYLGYVHGTLAALAAMRPRDEGAIIQIGSALAYRAIPLQSAYCAAKFAIRGFTDALRSELRHEGSRVRITMLQMPGMNTPQFDWARNKLPKKYKPVGSVYDPDIAAEAVWRAVHGNHRELWVGAPALQAIVGQMVAPALLDRMLAKSAWNGQLDTTEETPGRPDNLFNSIDGDQAARGRFGAQAKPKALMLDPEDARLGIGVLGALALAIGFGGATYAGMRRIRS